MSSTSAERSMAGQIGAHSKWAQTADRAAATAPARAGFMRRFEDEVDPDRTLPEAERTRRAESAMRAYMTRLRLSGAKKARGAKT